MIAAGVIRTAARRLVRLASTDTRPAPLVLSHRLGYRLQNSRYTALPFPDHTLFSLMRLETRPLWIRLLYFNDQPVPWRLHGAAVALTASIGDGYTPVGGNGQSDPGRWRRVTFRHAFDETETEPLEQEPTEVDGLDLPPNPRETGRPVLVFSDWISLAGPARDEGAGTLLLVRSYSREHVRYSGSVGLPDPSINQVHRGHWVAGDAAGASFDGKATPDDTIFACYGIQTIAATAGATVVGIGDSIIHSSCTTGELSGFGIRACAAISTPSRPVSYVNEGYPGRNCIGFCRNGAWMIRHLAPQVALIQTWTQNEDWTEAAADLAFGRAIALADLARRHGCVPILVTAAPVFASRPEPEAHRQRNVARVRAAGAAGMHVLDLDALWGTGTTPNAYRDDCGCGDGMHPSDAGCARVARVLVPMLEDILAGRMSTVSHGRVG
ncbi:MAG: hypothetical protein QOH05_4176 [Acetobacteraceae bacterium]|nr:hypothetical protein [Acetobacteraceae bacterium]